MTTTRRPPGLDADSPYGNLESTEREHSLRARELSELERMDCRVDALRDLEGREPGWGGAVGARGGSSGDLALLDWGDAE